MAHVALFVVRVVLQRDFHRMAAAFKSKLEGFVGHGSYRHLKPVVPFLSPLAVDKTIVTSSPKYSVRSCEECGIRIECVQKETEPLPSWR